jgi:hypothetical protein
MADILGPASDNAVTTRPARSITRGDSQTWFKNCTDPDAGDGTAFGADFFNDFLAQFLSAFSSAGISLDGADDMLWRAMNATGVRYGVDTGSASAIIVAFSPAPLAAHTAGKLLLVKLANDVTGAVTITPDGLTAKSVKWPDGTALAEGDAKAGAVLLLAYDSANYQLLCRMNGAGASSSPSFVPGQIAMWPLATPPSGTLECDGAEVSRTTYSRLFDIIGTTYGPGDNVTTFKLPDMRGMFPRGWAHGTTNDPDKATRTNRGDGTTGDNVGTRQADKVGPIALNGAASLTNVNAPNGLISGYVAGGGTGGAAPNAGDPHAHVIDSLNANISMSGGGSETRGRNVNVLFVIAY